MSHNWVDSTNLVVLRSNLSCFENADNGTLVKAFQQVEEKQRNHISRISS